MKQGDQNTKNLESKAADKPSEFGRVHWGRDYPAAVAKAKKDDFEQGAAQCVVEMVACRWSNLQENHSLDVYGIVSNGQGWQFYKLTVVGEVYESAQYGLEDLSGILGALDYVCGECAKNVPA